MLFSWLRSRRRRRLLAGPFPLRWLGIVEGNVGHYARLPRALQDRLRDVTRILVAEKRWLGRGGLFVTEEMKVTIAAQAALLLLGTDHGYFPRVREVVVFPGEFRTPVAEDDWEDDGLSEVPLAGQAVDQGPVLLAWDQVLAEGRNPDAGFNVVVHEFTHQLDFAHGLSNGRLSGPGGGDDEGDLWPILAAAYEDHRRATHQGSCRSFFTPHAADSPGEFFADATEAFYCRPHDLYRLNPAVYEGLRAFYRTDPVTWGR